MLLHKPPNQTDVARRAGVSTATVSRVLNGSDQVRPDVRSRVEAAILALNYVPHEAARSLASRRSHTLGAIIPTLNNAIFAQGINAFEQAGRAGAYTLLLSISNYDLDEERNLVRKMIERGVDGLLLIGNAHHAETFRMLKTARLRHVCAWAFEAKSAAPNIGFSNAEAMAEIVDHLVDLGHRRIAMLAGIAAANDRARERILGVRERLVHHGLSLDDNLLRESAYAIRPARDQFRVLAAQAPSAVICGNDVIAHGALLEAQALQLAVPGDIALTGFDNLPLAAELSPAITTVDVPAIEMGKACAAALISAIENDKDVPSKRLATRLLIRTTTMPQTPSTAPSTTPPAAPPAALPS